MSGFGAGWGRSVTGRQRAGLFPLLPWAGVAARTFVSLVSMVTVVSTAGMVSMAGEGNPESTGARVVVTTTLIGAAVSDVAGDWCRVDVLIPPAGCPGHFDIGPQALAALQGAALIMRHDYQQHLEARLREGQESQDRFVSLTVSYTHLRAHET